MKTIRQKIISRMLPFLLFIVTTVAYGQERNTGIDEITEKQGSTDWIHFRQDLRINPDQLFNTYARQLGLGTGDEMKVSGDYTNPQTGIRQVKYQHYYNGIEVHGSVVNVYAKNNVTTKANGRAIVNLNAPVTPVFDEAAALIKAMEEIPSDKYKWNNPQLEERIKVKKKSAEATYYPHGKLVYMYKKGSAKKSAGDYELCWKFPINVERGKSATVFVSAITGKIINKLPLTLNCDGTVVTLPMNGDKTVYTSRQNRCDNNPLYYELWDDCEVDIKVEDDGFGTGDDDPLCGYSPTNNWQTLNGGIYGDGLQVLWGMRRAYEWYLSFFNWESYNNSGGSIDCTVNYQFTNSAGNPTGKNAQYEEFEEDFDFGYGVDSGDETDSYTTLDIVGHEFTHGVDDYTADLDYVDESGALDESFADIFGEALEHYTDAGTITTPWLHGEDKGSLGRSFNDPDSLGYPDTYMGINWCDYNSTATCSENDNGGVHRNSSVQNKFFYLLTEGETGINDNGTVYSVSGIGWDDAIQIAFVAHTYLWGTADFHDSRDAWLEAASDLHGSCSDQAIQVGKAWHAVGVGMQSPGYQNLVTGNLSATSSHNTYQAINNVTTAGLTTISSLSGGSQVRFFAGTEIILNPGFFAPSGTDFLARINPCSFTIHTVPRLSSYDVGEPVTESKFSETGFNISPNPFSDKFTATFKLKEGEYLNEINILDGAGAKVQTQNLNGEDVAQIEIDAGGLKDGLYLVNVITNFRTLTDKAVKMSIAR